MTQSSITKTFSLKKQAIFFMQFTTEKAEILTLSLLTRQLPLNVQIRQEAHFEGEVKWTSPHWSNSEFLLSSVDWLRKQLFFSFIISASWMEAGVLEPRRRTWRKQKIVLTHYIISRWTQSDNFDRHAVPMARLPILWEMQSTALNFEAVLTDMLSYIAGSLY